jgi:site-specific DNA recombinase
MLDLFDKMRIDDEAVREWFRTILVLQTEDTLSDSTAQRTELQRQTSLLVAQQDRLINIHLGDIDQPAFAQKQTELRDRLASTKLQLDVLNRSHDEMTDLAVKAFVLSQTLRACFENQGWWLASLLDMRAIMVRWIVASPCSGFRS